MSDPARDRRAALTFLPGLVFSDQPIPDLIRHTVFRHVCVAWSRRHVCTGGELNRRLVRQVHIRRALLQTFARGQHRHLLQLFIVDRAQIESVINQLEAHASAEGIPSLQGEERTAGPSLDVLQNRWAPATRAFVAMTALAATGAAAAYARR